MSGGKLDRFWCVLGSGVGSHQLVTSSGGGLLQKSARASYTAHFAILHLCSYLGAVDRTARAAPAGTSGTEATPPFLPLVRPAGGWASYRPCYMACIPPLGVASVLTKATINS